MRTFRCLISSGLDVRPARLVLAHAFDQDVVLPDDEAGCVPLLELRGAEPAAVEARIEQLDRTRTHLTRLVGDVTRILAGKLGERAAAECVGAATARRAERTG